ncbi:MAG: transposase [Elusimicrobiota bacterium]
MSNVFVPNRQSIRLPGYDYTSQGIHYVTMCTRDHLNLFGIVKNEEMQLSPVGEMINLAWRGITMYAPRISLDEFVVMPDHLHAIIVIGPDLDGGLNHDFGQGRCPAPTAAISLPSIVRRFKSWTTHQYRKNIWQRNYYEHIVSDENDLNRIREYIKDNPKNWEKEK